VRKKKKEENIKHPYIQNIFCINRISLLFEDVERKKKVEKMAKLENDEDFSFPTKFINYHYLLVEYQFFSWFYFDILYIDKFSIIRGNI